jgi:hypothetical protein
MHAEDAEVTQKTQKRRRKEGEKKEKRRRKDRERGRRENYARVAKNSKQLFWVSFANFAFKKYWFFLRLLRNLCAFCVHIRLYLNAALGCESSTFTVNLPSKIAFSFARTFVTISAGIFFSNVPSGDSSEPLNFIMEYWP